MVERDRSCQYAGMSIEGPVWMVRAGEGGAMAEEFRKGGYVGIGWPEVGDIKVGTPDEEIRKRFEKAYPEWSENSRRSSIGQVRRFLGEFKEGDAVATYDPDQRLYLLGKISGRPEWSTGEYPRVRKVEWKREVSRDRLSASTRNSLGSTLTIFRLSAEIAREMWDRSVAFGASEESIVPPTESEATVAEALSLAKEQAAKADQAIEDSINSLTWEEMQELVAAILRAMGYKTKVFYSADRGRDVFASPDGLGLQEPRIFAEVKHRGKKISAPDRHTDIFGRSTSRGSMSLREHEWLR